MSKMQETGDDEGYEGANLRQEGSIQGYVARSKEVVLHMQNDRVLATLSPPVFASEYDASGLVPFRCLKSTVLEWSPLAALVLLDGLGVQDLLFTAGTLLLDGHHRPVYSPQPGIDNVMLAQFDVARVPFGMKSGELFGLIHSSLSDSK